MAQPSRLRDPVQGYGCQCLPGSRVQARTVAVSEQVADLSVAQRAARIAAGLHDLIDGDQFFISEIGGGDGHKLNLIADRDNSISASWVECHLQKGRLRG